MKLKNHLRAFPFVGGIAIAFVIMIVLVDFDPVALVIFGEGFAFVFLPVLWLHLEYYYTNNDQEIFIDGKGITVVENGNIKRVIPRERITKILYCKTQSVDADGVYQFPTERYYFARIMVTEGQELVITSLMTEGNFVELGPLRKIPSEIRRPLFASVHYPVLLPPIEAILSK